MHDGLFEDTSYNVLDFGDYLSLVLLDTGHISPIGGEQTAWLDKTLAARVDCPNLFVYNHVPAYPSHQEFDSSNGGGTGADNRKYWTPLFRRYNVDVVFEHHDHMFERTKPMLDGHVDEDGAASSIWATARGAEFAPLNTPDCGPIRRPITRPIICRCTASKVRSVFTWHSTTPGESSTCHDAEARANQGRRRREANRDAVESRSSAATKPFSFQDRPAFRCL